MLLNTKQRLVALLLDVQLGQEVRPVSDQLLLSFTEASFKFLVLFFQLAAILLVFPVVSKHLLNSLLVGLELVLKLVGPDHLGHYLGEVSKVAQRQIHFFFVEQLCFELFNVLGDLTNQLRLILGNGATDLGPHEELVVDAEDLEHFVGGFGVFQLFLEYCCQLGLNLASRSFVDFLCCVPNQDPFRFVVKHVDSFDEDFIGALHVTKGFFSHVGLRTLRILFIFAKGILNDLLQFVVLGAEGGDQIESFKQGVVSD